MSRWRSSTVFPKTRRYLWLSFLLGVPIICVYMNHNPPADGHKHCGVVVYALRDIFAGSMIRAAALKVDRLDESQIPDDAVAQATAVAGQFARVTIKAGQLICVNQLAPQGSIHYENYNIEAEKEWKAALQKFGSFQHCDCSAGSN